MKFFSSLLCVTLALNAFGLAHAAPIDTAWAADPRALSANDAALLRPVSIEAKRLPLPEFARQLGEKAGVRLKCPDALGVHLVSARLEALPLHEALRALSRLYGLEWSAAPQSYSARQATSKLETRWLQLGDVGETQARRTNRPNAKALTAQALQDTDGAALRTPQGVLLSARPQLAELVRADRETLSAFRLLSSWGQTMPWVLGNGWLRAEAVPKGAKQWALFDAGGSKIASVATLTRVETQSQK